ncbi:TraR/DksA C4-type zinc finger protein [Candidatus Gottesmanbacteria bacterium]|nr:TraR/DksA C4-type zinc finger protein [Candidatus Gottesmanbacteria bacterium]
MIKIPKELLEELNIFLTNEKKQLKSRIQELRLQDPASDLDRLSDNAASDTEAKEEVNHDIYQAMISELKLKLEAIDTALLRISKGTYGMCTRCKKMIDTDRLAAIPTALLCMTCEAERQKKRTV